MEENTESYQEPGSHACAVCGRVLDLVWGQGWRHTDLPDAERDDHVAVPVPVDQLQVRGRCDLCAGEPVVAVAHTEPITLAGVTTAGDTEAFAGFDGDWACCAVCARLLRRGRWEQLLTRAVNAISASTGDPVDAHLVTVTRQLHDQLRATLHGPPEPFPPRN